MNATPIPNRTDARAGDVVLFHRPFTWRNFLASPWGTLMTGLIHLTTRSRFNHAALMVAPDLLAEATDRGVVTSSLSGKGDEVTIVRPAYRDEWDLNETVTYAKARVGERYGYLTAFMCGTNDVLVGLHLVIKRGDEVICSELVAEALERAGADFGTDTALVSPGDLAVFLGVER